MGYLTASGFKAVSTIPSTFVDDIEAAEPGWTQAQLDHWSSWIDSKLRKRYAAPFSSPYPVTVQSWLQRIVTHRCYLKRGIDATDQAILTVQEDAQAAIQEVFDAANPQSAIADLPLRADTTATGISKAGPRSYTERSPYTWSDEQRKAAANE